MNVTVMSNNACQGGNKTFAASSTISPKN